MDETINWDTPIPIDAAPDVPHFPIDALPGHIGNYVHALAEETQVPVDAVASVVLGTMAACVAGKAVISPRGNWEEPLCLYTVTAMDPGSRKSAVFKLATKPLKDVEVELQQAMAPVIASAIDLKEFKESAAKRAKNGKNADEYLQLAQAAREVEVPAEPRLLVDDITPEKLADPAIDQGGRMAVASAEGGIFETFAGRYSNGIPNVDVMKKGHAGDSHSVDRMNGQSKSIDSLVITFILAVQPSVLRMFGNGALGKSTGQLERWMYSIPRSFVGYRNLKSAAVPAAVAEAYRATISSVAHKFARRDDVLRLTMTPDATEAFEAMEEGIEVELRDTGIFGDPRAKGWGSKLLGAIARMAGILHLILEREGTAVDRDLILAAGKMGDYFTEHALAVFKIMAAEEDKHGAEDVIKILKEKDLRTFKTRDLMRASRAKFPNAESTKSPIAILLEHGWIAEGEGCYVSHPQIFGTPPVTAVTTVTDRGATPWPCGGSGCINTVWPPETLCASCKAKGAA